MGLLQEGDNNITTATIGTGQVGVAGAVRRPVILYRGSKEPQFVFDLDKQ